MVNEKERKYLCNFEDAKAFAMNNRHKGTHILDVVQGYIGINEPKISQVRIAAIGQIIIKEDKRYDADEFAILNIKGIRNGDVRPEYESRKMNYDDGVSLLQLIEHKIIKTRYKIPYIIDKEKYLLEIDFYGGSNFGLCICEIEIPEDKDFPTKLPDFFIKDVTDDEKYYNKELAINPYNTWNV